VSGEPPYHCFCHLLLAVTSEFKRTSTLKTKLEELCRQLQKENREVVEDAKRHTEEEAKQRQELQQRFTQAINVGRVTSDSCRPLM
jgi:aspartate-semialdehyde dehydrogenase